MIRGLYTAVSGLISQEAKQQTITSNLANANTAGYKKDDLRFKDFREAMLVNYDKVMNGKNYRTKLGEISMGTKIDDVVTKYTQGPIVETGNKTDFAIDGKGFFTVMDDKGNKYYTRDGNFKTNIEGDLVNSSGHKVLGYKNGSGNLEPIQVGNGKIQCDVLGNVSINNVKKYKFAISGFEEGQVKKLGDNLYTSTANPKKENSYVKQGYIEKSNVNIVNEMVDMMTTMRNFESNQKAVQMIDESLGKLINGAGSVK
ncbi:flagellar hook-basal body complex protein [Haloimpatiens sp. FM7315]|uniref:flagellar hook-basal body complex protein n=1 Tax=Haloimpatiens sp. FM7315 TaxID=3298609 RepID=UPI0035A2E67B